MNSTDSFDDRAPGEVKPPDKIARSQIVEICNRKGLHARASAKFVQLVERFEADVTVCRGGEKVGGTSIMGLMMLAASPGTKIKIEVIGPESAEALEALVALVADRFGEED